MKTTKRTTIYRSPSKLACPSVHAFFVFNLLLLSGIYMKLAALPRFGPSTNAIENGSVRSIYSSISHITTHFELSLGFHLLCLNQFLKRYIYVRRIIFNLFLVYLMSNKPKSSKSSKRAKQRKT